MPSLVNVPYKQLYVFDNVKEVVKFSPFKPLEKLLEELPGPYLVVVTDITEPVCEFHCSSSLVAIDMKVIVIGKAKRSEKTRAIHCGSELYYEDCYIYQLEKGAIVIYSEEIEHGSEITTRTVIYVNP